MRLCVIGCGNVGRLVAKNRGVLGVSLKFFDRHPERCFEVCKDDCEVSTSFDEFLEGCDLVVEAASPEAVRQYAPQVLRKADMVVLSVGALMDKELYGRLLRIAENYGTSIVVPSGAVAGIDAIKALKNAGIEEVQVITTKNPKALGVNVEEKTVLFEGPASEAVKRFPTNVNVVATVSLAAGKEATVKVVADPSVDKGKVKGWGALRQSNKRTQPGQSQNQLVGRTIPYRDPQGTRQETAYKNRHVTTSKAPT